MLRYRLDDLGWDAFERLMVSLLKARWGAAVRGSLRSHDRGRDVFCEGRLAYPDHVERRGPFLWQCKYVDAANAAGARSWGPVKRAVKAEAVAIRARLDAGLWKEAPQFFTLCTNAPLGEGHREEVRQVIGAALPSATVLCMDGGDICAEIDLCIPSLSRAFPELLGLRDLSELVRQAGNAVVLERSTAALEDVAELASIFVPTEAYTRARRVLTDHSFVLLSGAPEMGKTAIGRMLGALQAAHGWEFFEIRGPDEFLNTYRRSRSQVFIADDFFGRTEYRPSLTAEWETELPFIMRKLDSRHWLVLTSRAHLVQMAAQRIDPARPAQSFPSPGEVVVDVSDLSRAEKARMLYRHARQESITSAVRLAVKRNCVSVTTDKHFTPERIRRLVEETLPALGEEVLASKVVATAIRHGLADPTKGVVRTFRALPASHRWVLFAMLEVRWMQKEMVRRRYEALAPPDSRGNPIELLDELENGFVRQRSDWIDWVHPSYRDLVVSELGRDSEARSGFLQRCGIRGVELACSSGGGARGDVSFPLLQTETDWATFEVRCHELLPMGLSIIRVLGDAEAASIAAGSKDVKRRKRLRELLVRLLPAAATELLHSDPATDVVQHFLGVAARLDVEIPNKRELMRTLLQRRSSAASKEIADIVPWGLDDSIDDFARALRLVRDHAPGVLELEEAVNAVVAVDLALQARGDERLSQYSVDWEDEEIETGLLLAADALESLTDSLPAGEADESRMERFSKLARRYREEAAEAEEKRSEIDPDPELLLHDEDELSDLLDADQDAALETDTGVKELFNDLA